MSDIWVVGFSCKTVDFQIVNDNLPSFIVLFACNKRGWGIGSELIPSYENKVILFYISVHFLAAKR